MRESREEVPLRGHVGRTPSCRTAGREVDHIHSALIGEDFCPLPPLPKKISPGLKFTLVL